MNQPYEDTEKIWAPDGYETHDSPCLWSRTQSVVGLNPIWGLDLLCPHMVDFFPPFIFSFKRA